MDFHTAITHQAVRSLDGLTAFSALPDAPVLPVKQPRRFGFGRVRRLAGARCPRRPAVDAGHHCRSRLPVNGRAYS